MKRRAHTVFGLLLPLALACAGSSSPTTERDVGVTAGETFTLARGQSVSVANEDLRLTFRDVKGDSRCPKNVVCVWAGDAAIEVRATSGNETRDVELHTSQEPRSAEVFGHMLELALLEPYPEDPGGIRPEEYVAHLVVR